MDTIVKNPKVSVVMPLYNSEKYIREAIQSVLNQSFTDFEFIILNDGSTDKSLEIIMSFMDNRIVLINNDCKIHTLVEARNRCFELSRGMYIAPLDSDDIADKDRLKSEVDFLDSHPDYGLVGANVRVIDNQGKPTGTVWKENIPDAKIPIRLLFSNCFSQSSVMIRKEAVPEAGYIEGTSEDYALWVRISKKWKIARIPLILLNYRVHIENTTSRKAVQLYQAVNDILLAQLKDLGIEANFEELAIHRANYTFKGSDKEIKKFIDQREQWLIRLIKANQISKHYPTTVFDEVIAERFLTTLESNAKLGFYVWKRFRTSILSKKINTVEELKKIIKLFIKSLVRRNTI